MRKMVTIARALKEKNRVAGRLAKARQLVNKENSQEVKIPRSVDVRAYYDLAKNMRERLVAIKSAIAIANQPIVGLITEMAELKSEISYLNSLNTKEGLFEESSYGANLVKEYKSIVKSDEVLEEIAILQKRIEDLQDRLDEFNASVKIEIDVD